MIEYVREYLFAQSLRVMSTDFIDDSFNYYRDKKTGEILELNKEAKDNIINSIKELSNQSLNQLREFFIKNQIDSNEKYQKNYDKIENFVNSLVESQKKQIQELIENLEVED
ncbi:MAG: hypothetical protein ACTSVV_05320 [Promethearchaeota archaeon]